MREKGVKMKLSAVRSLVAGKRVALIDDSIVRGTTSLRIVRLLKAAGAKEVHVRIASPKMTHPCFYGVDTSTCDQLIGHRCSVEEICRQIEADSLAFLSEGALLRAGNRKEMCMACFTAVIRRRSTNMPPRSAARRTRTVSGVFLARQMSNEKQKKRYGRKL